MGAKTETGFVSSAFGVPKTEVRVCSGCFDSAASTLSSFVGVDEVDGFSGSRLSSPPVFNKSENDVFGEEKEPKVLEEPPKDAKAPPVVVVFVGVVGVAGVVGVKGDFAAPRIEGEPNAGVAVVDVLVLGEGLMGAKAETTGGVCSGFLKNGESVGVVLPKAPKPAAGLKEEGVVWRFAKAPPTTGGGGLLSVVEVVVPKADTALTGSGDDGGDMAAGFTRVSSRILVFASLARGLKGDVVDEEASRAVPSTEVLVEALVAGLGASAARAVDVGNANEANPVPDDGLEDGANNVEPKDVGAAEEKAEKPPDAAGFDSVELKAEG